MQIRDAETVLVVLVDESMRAGVLEEVPVDDLAIARARVGGVSACVAQFFSASG